MRRRRRRAYEFAMLLVIIFVLWQIWQRVHFVYIARIPWWGPILLAVALIVAADLLLSRILDD